MKRGKEVTDEKQVDNELFHFYKNLFKSDKRSSKYDIAQFLSSIKIPRLTEEQSDKCEIFTSEDELNLCIKEYAKK